MFYFKKEKRERERERKGADQISQQAQFSVFTAALVHVPYVCLDDSRELSSVSHTQLTKKKMDFEML